MKSMKGAFWIVYFFLIISMLFGTTYAKSGGSYSGSSYSGRSSYSGGSSYSRGSYSYSSGGYSRYYSSYGDYDNYYSRSSSGGSGLAGLWISLFCSCGCCIFVFCYKKRTSNNAHQAASEYNAAVIYSMQNPPQVSPPDFTGEVRMVTDPSASSAVQNSVHFDELSNIVRFVSNQSVEDRCIQSNVRIMGYYEVTITNIENRVCIALGYATKPYPPFRLPGWEKHSIAYHSDNGNKFFNDPANGMQYGPRYGAGDIIGCGYTNSPNGDQVFFFTRNGQHLGIAFTTRYLMGETFAIIGADGPCSMSVNFGNDVNRPFSCHAINFGTTRGPPVQMGIPVGQPIMNVRPYVAPPQGQNTVLQPSQYSGAPSAYAPTQYQSSIPQQSIPNQIPSALPPAYSSIQTQNAIPHQSFPNEGQPSAYAPPQIQSSIPPPQGNIPYQAPPNQYQGNMPYQAPPNQYPATGQYQAPSSNEFTAPPPNQSV